MKRFFKLWPRLRNIAAVLGFLCIYCSAGTMDLYAYELHETEPTLTWWLISIGFALLIPTIIRLVREHMGE